MSAEDPSEPEGFAERLRAARASQRERTEGKPRLALSGGVLGVGCGLGSSWSRPSSLVQQWGGCWTGGWGQGPGC